MDDYCVAATRKAYSAACQDEEARAQVLIEDAFKAGYLAGFNRTGEGYNAEYPFNDHNLQPQYDKVWLEVLDEEFKKYKLHCS